MGVTNTKERTVDTETECNNCKKRGHLARVCRASIAYKPPNASQSGKGRDSQRNDTNWVSETKDYEHYPETMQF